jgi:GntR family transcriptional regulator
MPGQELRYEVRRWSSMAGMEPQPTKVLGPVQLRIADDLRMRIERGELRPGEKLPSANELAKAWGCSPGAARAGLNLLKKQGLMTVGQGARPIVRIPPRRSVLRQDTMQAEKDRVLLPEDERRRQGTAEDNLQVPIDDLDFKSRYNRIPAPEDLAEAFGVKVGTELLRREYETANKTSGVLELQAVSYIPVDLIKSNPALLDESNEPWPGGTQHQLYTVGIEVVRMDTEVTAMMPTTVEMQQWAMMDGIPLLCTRKLATDTQDHVVEISDACYPADRTKMLFSIALKPWEKGH